MVQADAWVKPLSYGRLHKPLFSLRLLMKVAGGVIAGSSSKTSGKQLIFQTNSSLRMCSLLHPWVVFSYAKQRTKTKQVIDNVSL